MTNRRAGSLRKAIVDRFLEELGITRDQVDKMTKLWDEIDVKKTDDGLEINVKLKNIQVKIETE